MGFAAEMKDFNASMSTAGKFWDSRADRKLKQAKADSYKITDSDLNGQPNTFTGAGGTGLSSGTGTPNGGVPSNLDQNQVFNGFMDTVQSGYGDPNHRVPGVTNPYGLAAIAATGQRESGYDPGNVNRTWDDGGKPSGGIMSWRDDRLDKLHKFSGGNNGTPIQQAQFFLSEDPNLIARLNSAKSVEEAQAAMNDAWGFTGHDNPNNPETKARYASANSFYNKFKDKWGAGPTATASAPSTGTGAVAAGSDEGEGEQEGDGDSDDTGTDTSQAQQPAQPVQTAQAAPFVPPPAGQGAIPTAPSSPAQFASAQGSGFSAAAPPASAQPSQQAQPAQVAAAQPRAMNQGAGVSRVADAMTLPEEQARMRQLQQGQLFAAEGGVIPENFGTPEIQKYYARGGTVPKVEHQSTSEWLYDQLPAWLTGEDTPPPDISRRREHLQGETAGPRDPRPARPNEPYNPNEPNSRQASRFDLDTGPEPDRPRQGPPMPPPKANFPKGERPVPADTQSKEDRDAKPTDASGTAATLADRAAADRRTVPPPTPIETSRRQQESMDMTSGPREPPAIPVPQDDAQALTDDRNRQMGAQRNSVDKLRERMGAPGGNAPGEQMGPPAPPPQTVSQQVSAGARPVIPERGQKEPTSPPVIPPDQPHTMSRALRPDEQAAPTATAPQMGPPAPPPQTVAQQVSAQARPVIPERGQKEDVPPTPAAQPQAADDYDPTAAWKDADTDRLQNQTRDMTAGPREPPPGQPPQQAPRDVLTPYTDPNADTQGAIPAPEKQGPPPPPRPDGVDPNYEATPYVSAKDPESNQVGVADAVVRGLRDTYSGVIPAVKSAVGSYADALQTKPEDLGQEPEATPAAAAADEKPAAPGEIAGAIPVPGARPANPINGEVPVPQDRPDRPTRPQAPVTQVAAAGRTAPAPTTRHAPQPVQPSPAGGQGRMLNAGSQSPRINAGSTAAQVRDSRPASPRYMVQHQGHDNPRTVAVAAVGAHHGLDFIRHIFGFDGSSNEAIPSGRGHNQVGMRRFINGAGAATPRDNAAIDQIAGIDPNLPDGLKHVERLSKVTQVYMSRGMKKEASMAAASQMLYAADQVSRLGSLSGQAYQNYLQSGDPKELENSLKFIAQAHSYIPSGESFDVHVDPQTNHIVATITDLDGQTTQHEVSPQELPGIINATRDKSAYWRGIEAIADPAAARARANREATESRWERGQQATNNRQQEGFKHQEKMAGDRQAAADVKDTKKAAADAAKTAAKTVNTSKYMPLAKKVKDAEAAQKESGSEDTRDIDIAASEAYDAIPDGVKDKNAYFRDTVGKDIGDYNYMTPEERAGPAPPPKESNADYYLRMGNPSLAADMGVGGKPAATAAAPPRPAGIPPEAKYSPSKKGWVVENSQGGYDVVTGT